MVNEELISFHIIRKEIENNVGFTRVFRKKVRVTCIDGEVIKGIVSSFESAADCDDEYGYIGIRCKMAGGFDGIEVCQDEIAEIKALN